MRVLIAYQYFSFKGGIEHVIGAQARALAADGHEVAVLTSSYLEDLPREIAPGIPIHRLGALNYCYDKLGIPFAVPLPTRRNARIVAEAFGDVDVVNIHGHPYLFSYVMNLVARRRKIPVVLTQHNTDIRSDSRLIDGVYALAEKTISRWNLQMAARVVAVSGETKRYVAGLLAPGSEKVTTIYNGIDAERFVPAEDKAALRRELGIPEEKFVCLTVRRITFKNGIDTLLQAAEQNNDPAVHFLLGGTGADLAEVRRYVAERDLENVSVLGPIADDALPKYYAAADAFVLPSRQGEGFPMVVLESFASGVPVIATRSGGHVEVMEDGQNGFVVPPGAPGEINARIADLLSCDRTTMAKHCRELVVTRFTWPANVEQLLGVLEAAQGERR